MVDASNSVTANLKDKEGVRDLELRWRSISFGAEVEDGGADSKGVLDGLRPHQNIKKLFISDYGGSEFSSWLGDPTFNKIVEVRLWNCEKCMSLPPLGILPNLKELYIERMSSLERVNEEFYGNNCSNSFPCLEVLHFKEMDNWKEWNGFEFEFRVVRKFNIEGCKNLVAALPSLPMVRELKIRSCKEVDLRSIVDFNSLTQFKLFEISRIKNLAGEGFVKRLKKFTKLTVSDFGSWTVYEDWACGIGKCPHVLGTVVEEEKEELQMELARGELESLLLTINVNLPKWIQKAVFLRKLTIRNCKSLTELTLCNLVCLEKVKVENCDSLISLERRQFPSTLKKLYLNKCTKLRKLLDEGEAASSSSSSSINLEYLEVKQCDNLTSISSTRDLPTTLKQLNIYSCERIESIAKGFDTNSSLETFIISNCSNLQSLPEGLHNLIYLHEFRLYNCPCIVSFPKGGLPTTRLKNLIIQNLEKLEALPDNLHTLSSLRELDIHHFPSLMSFPSEGLPSNLTSLDISSKHLFEFGMNRLNSLEELCIYGGIGERRRVLWGKIGTMLLPSLNTLEIRDFPNLKYISCGDFHHLSSLTISDCPKLAFFRKNDLPNSLTYLRIECCPKLGSFPKNGLPDSLVELDVSGCPIMTKRCKEGKRPEWFKIFHIPLINIS